MSDLLQACQVVTVQDVAAVFEVELAPARASSAARGARSTCLFVAKAGGKPVVHVAVFHGPAARKWKVPDRSDVENMGDAAWWQDDRQFIILHEDAAYVSQAGPRAVKLDAAAKQRHEALARRAATRL